MYTAAAATLSSDRRFQLFFRSLAATQKLHEWRKRMAREWARNEKINNVFILAHTKKNHHHHLVAEEKAKFLIYFSPTSREFECFFQFLFSTAPPDDDNKFISFLLFAHTCEVIVVIAREKKKRNCALIASQHLRLFACSHIWSEWLYFFAVKRDRGRCALFFLFSLYNARRRYDPHAEEVEDWDWEK